MSMEIFSSIWENIIDINSRLIIMLGVKRGIYANFPQ